GEWLVSPAIEAGHAVGVWFAAWWLLAEIAMRPSARGEALVAAASWAVTPLLVENARRGTVLGERCFGYAFGHAFLFCTVALVLTHHFAWLALAVGCLAVVAASSKFALQASAFIGTTLSLLLLDPAPVLALAAGFVAAVLLSRGYALRVLGGTVHHVR